MTDVASRTPSLLSLAFLGRTWHLATALIGAAGFIFQIYALVNGPRYAVDPANAWWNFGSYFTIESNFLVLFISLTLAANSARAGGQVWRVLRLMSLVNITVTMIIQFFLLRDLPEIQALRGAGLYADRILHYVVPLMVILGWVVFGPRPRISIKTTFLILVFPVIWCIYTVIRGALTGWYPYPFINVTEQGALVIVNCILVGVVFLAVGFVYYWLDRTLRPAPDAKPQASAR
ncbi:Pr6Pr family membrane protein [Paeniglutamicibacter antarcticus]|uniref:Pr6Pr family membrane protein n=1 Tax=Arthrobacter terrae TaxID=2935737 RepID=A0A931CTP3_9MICC|nr:Pr6Pr family membrane protein [Arthrobacter terrae]MBG0739628.1 Pr6Pr family membrane protein [Arthrobacter terrae]